MSKILGLCLPSRFPADPASLSSDTSSQLSFLAPGAVPRLGIGTEGGSGRPSQDPHPEKLAAAGF